MSLLRWRNSIFKPNLLYTIWWIKWFVCASCSYRVIFWVKSKFRTAVRNYHKSANQTNEHSVLCVESNKLPASMAEYSLNRYQIAPSFDSLICHQHFSLCLQQSCLKWDLQLMWPWIMKKLVSWKLFAIKLNAGRQIYGQVRFSDIMGPHSKTLMKRS